MPAQRFVGKLTDLEKVKSTNPSIKERDSVL